MPIYEYECQKCGEVFEVNQSIVADPLKKHSETDSTCKGKVTKLMSMNSFQLKGGGWFKDGYSGPSNQKSDPKPKDSGAAPKSKDSGAAPKSKEGGSKAKPAKKKKTTT